jgi:hypothetical protein
VNLNVVWALWECCSWWLELRATCDIKWLNLFSLVIQQEALLIRDIWNWDSVLVGYTLFLLKGSLTSIHAFLVGPLALPLTKVFFWYHNTLIGIVNNLQRNWKIVRKFAPKVIQHLKASSIYAPLNGLSHWQWLEIYKLLKLTRNSIVPLSLQW